MKFLPIALSLACAWGVAGHCALAQQAKVPAVDPLKGSVTLPAQGTSLDDDLIALGRAGKINVIADASTWPADAPALSGSRAGSPPRLLEANEQLPLSWLGRGDTVLVWARPDVLALARRIAAGESIRRIAIPPAPAPPIAAPAVAPPKPAIAPDILAPGAGQFNGVDVKALVDNARENARLAQTNERAYWEGRWNEYLSQLADGRERPVGWTREVALVDLPPDLHAFVLARAQSHLLPVELMAHWKAWVTEDFWNTARLQIRDMETTVSGRKTAEAPQKKMVSMLFLRNTLQVVPGQRGNTMMSIAILGDAPTAQALAQTVPNAPTQTR